MAVWRLSDHHSSPIIFAPLSCNQSVQNEILIRQRSPAFVGIWYVRAPFIWILWLTSNHCRLKASHIFLNLIPPAPPVVTIPSDCQVLNCVLEVALLSSANQLERGTDHMLLLVHNPPNFSLLVHPYSSIPSIINLKSFGFLYQVICDESDGSTCAGQLLLALVRVQCHSYICFFPFAIFQVVITHLSVNSSLWSL